MFKYLELSKLMVFITDPKNMRFGRRGILPQLSNYLENEGIEADFYSEFYADENINIICIYGKSNYAMLHDMFNSKYTFILFPDYILKKEHKYMEIYRIISDIMHHILVYAFHPMRVPISPHIKDAYKQNIKSDIKNICVYNLYSVFGENFLEEYKKKYPEDRDIDKHMAKFDLMFG